MTQMETPECCITSEEGTAAFWLISLNGHSIQDKGVQRQNNAEPPNNTNTPSPPSIEDPITNDANDGQQNNPSCNDFLPSTHLQDNHTATEKVVAVIVVRAQL